MRELLERQIQELRRCLDELDAQLRGHKEVRGPGAVRVSAQLGASQLKIEKLLNDPKLSLGLSESDAYWREVQRRHPAVRSLDPPARNAS